MVDIYRTRRYYNYKCKHWKRDETGNNNSNVLFHEKAPDSLFYAKILSDNSKDKQQFAGVLNINMDEIVIQTQDKVDVGADDIVLFNKKKWFVTRVIERQFQRNAEFTNNTSKLTDIYMRKSGINGR